MSWISPAWHLQSEDGEGGTTILLSKTLQDIPGILANLLHIPFFALLALSLAWALRRNISSCRQRPAIAFFVAMAFGLINEWSQQFVVLRYSSPTDLLLNLVGAALGAGFYCAYSCSARSQLGI